jgi:hypothetical protein
MVEHEPEAGLQGFEFLREARNIQPGLKAVLMTTLLNAEVRGADDSRIELLRKPFSVQELRRVVEPFLPALAAASSGD